MRKLYSTFFFKYLCFASSMNNLIYFEESSRASKRGPGMYGDQRQPQQSAMPPISGYNHQQTNFDRSSGGGFRDADGGSNYVERRNFGDSNRWREPSNRLVWISDVFIHALLAAVLC